MNQFFNRDEVYLTIFIKNSLITKLINNKKDLDLKNIILLGDEYKFNN